MSSLIYQLSHIETPRLLLRPIQLADTVPLNQAIERSLTCLQQWQAWAKNSTLASTQAFVEQGIAAWQSGEICNFPMAVIHKQDQHLIAASGFNEHSDASQGLYEIGYWCEVAYQGQGLVTEYVNALTRYALQALRANIVVLKIEASNQKSIAVAERLSFVRQATPTTFRGGRQLRDYTTTLCHGLPALDITWSHV